MSPPTEQDLDNLSTNLKRCSPETVEAAVQFRTTGDVAHPRHRLRHHRAAPCRRRTSATSANPRDDTRLIEDLGIDSLTLLEIVLSIEETVGISIENEELREIRTLGEVKIFHRAQDHRSARAGGTRGQEGADLQPRGHRDARLPQQPPFMFVDEAEIERQRGTRDVHDPRRRGVSGRAFQGQPGDARLAGVRGRRPGGVPVGAGVRAGATEHRAQP